MACREYMQGMAYTHSKAEKLLKPLCLHLHCMGDDQGGALFEQPPFTGPLSAHLIAKHESSWACEGVFMDLRSIVCDFHTQDPTPCSCT